MAIGRSAAVAAAACKKPKKKQSPSWSGGGGGEEEEAAAILIPSHLNPLNSDQMALVRKDLSELRTLAIALMRVSVCLGYGKPP